MPLCLVEPSWIVHFFCLKKGLQQVDEKIPESARSFLAIRSSPVRSLGTEEKEERYCTNPEKAARTGRFPTFPASSPLATVSSFCPMQEKTLPMMSSPIITISSTWSKLRGRVQRIEKE